MLSSPSSLGEWLRYVFDHAATGPEWYFDPHADVWPEDPPVVVRFLTTLFENPEPHLAPYSDGQVNQGLWFIVSNGCSNHFFALLDESVPWESRRRCLRAMVPLYERLFAARCTPHLSHLFRYHTPPQVSPLNSVCYMWWDIAPVCGSPGVPSRREFDAECLEVMRRILTIPHDACRESALHGLGHWQMYYPKVIQPVMDDFLASTPHLCDELRAYAQAARSGCVQ